jgi:preprotein translocase subunit SecY
MFKTLKNAWRQPELKNKLLFTALIIIIYRLGCSIPVPYFNLANTGADFTRGNILEFLNMLSGGALTQGTLLALGVSPYITSSIVMQLLTVAIPKLGEIAKNGEEGKRIINMWTRIVTILLAIVTAIGYCFILESNGLLLVDPNFFQYVILVACYCAGAALVMWLAEKINDSGIGNGISIILFAGIIASLPSQLGQLWTNAFDNVSAGGFYWVGLIVSLITLAMLIGLLLLIVWMSDAERRIPIQYAKRVVGRKMYGGQNTNLPIKVNMSGVMPIIFANSIVAVPATIAQLFFPDSWFNKTFIAGWFNYNTIPYLIVFFILMIAFAYFYVAISFDPVEVSNNIKNNGGAIPGIRSGRPTVDFIKKILGRITLVGALLVSVVACAPMIEGIILGYFPSQQITAMAFSGSSMMIVVGVAIETVRELEAQLSLRNYKGFLD